jgi:hypothetical protein
VSGRLLQPCPEQHVLLVLRPDGSGSALAAGGQVRRPPVLPSLLPLGQGGVRSSSVFCRYYIKYFNLGMVMNIDTDNEADTAQSIIYIETP